MKKCPICDKTFDDAMRFCQTDGTALVDEIEEAPQDPYKTVVASKDDISSAIPLPEDPFSSPPPADPFKTVVAGSQKDESGDLLQLPEEYDPMKTAVVSADELKEQFGASEPPPADEPGISEPPSPFGESESPFELNADDDSDVSSSEPPELPKFNEPSLNPPDFSDMSLGGSSEAPAESEQQTDSFSFEPPPAPEPPPRDSFGDSPFDRASDEAPIPSPFGDASKSFEPPPFKESEPPTVLGGSNPFEQPPTFEEPLNQPFTPPPAQPAEWTPPPAPVSGWQDQGLGANTPFQPPVATQGLSQGLAIASLVCGAISLIGLGGLIIPLLNYACFALSLILAIAAIVTGFLARSRVKNNPDQYGGAGLALGGIITGALTLLALAGLILLAVIAVAYWGMR